MVISLRKAQHNKAEMLADMCFRAYNTDILYGAPKKPGGPPGYNDPNHHRNLMKWVNYYMIHDDDDIVGGIIVQPCNKYHNILGQIFIDPEHLRKGYGSKAILLAEEMYPSVKMWTLGTPSWNTRTKPFYEGLGYVHVGFDVGPDDTGIWYQKTMKHDDPYVMPLISEIRDGQRDVDVEGTVIEQSHPRKVRSHDGRESTLVNSVLSDDSGSITLVQWNEQINQASVGDKIRLEKCHVKSYRGLLQIGRGYTGYIIKLL